VNLISPEYFGVFASRSRAGSGMKPRTEVGRGLRSLIRHWQPAIFPKSGAIGRSIQLPQLEEDSPGAVSAPKVAAS
jgi:hypothetical protein